MPLDRARFALISREADRRAAPIATAAILPILKTARKEFAQRVMDGEDGRKAARAVAKIAQTPLSVTHHTHLFDFANRGFELAGLFLERKGFLNVKPRSKSIVTDMDQNPALTSKFLNVNLKDWIKATSTVETETTAAQYETLWKNLMQEGLTDARSLGKAIMEMGLTADANRADVMARTMSIYGYNAGACDQYRDAGCEEKEWMVTEDDATCSLCSPYDGRVVKIGGVFESAGKDPLSLGIQNPPLHPRCRCCLLPVV